MVSIPRCKCGMGGCDGLNSLHDMRMTGKADQAEARRQADLKEQETALRERTVARQLRTLEPAEDAPAEGLTLADFRHDVTLLGVERLPSALDRIDGETLIYEGRFNTVYGEAAMGKTWIAIMTAIQALRAGRRVMWWDSEDRASTLARRLQLLRATDLIGSPDLAWVTGDIHESETARAEALDFLDFGAYGAGIGGHRLGNVFRMPSGRGPT